MTLEKAKENISVWIVIGGGAIIMAAAVFAGGHYKEVSATVTTQEVRIALAEQRLVRFEDDQRELKQELAQFRASVNDLNRLLTTLERSRQ